LKKHSQVPTAERDKALTRCGCHALRTYPNAILSIVVALLVLASGCCRVPSQVNTPTPPNSDTALQLSSATSTPRGVVLVIHGLNQQPDTMTPLAAFLNAAGYHTYRLVLEGHAHHGQQPFSEHAWVSNVADACSNASKRFPNLPIHILAYSLGGLVVTRTLDEDTPCSTVKSMIFIAPALSLRAIVQSGYLLSLLPPISLSVPNVAPRYYRRFSHTPLFWYQNTFSLYSDTRRLRHPQRIGRVPTLVFANHRDELVSLQGLQSWLESNRLADAWKVKVLHPKPSDPFTPEHLMIDARSLGPTHWSDMTATIRDFLRSAET
jgi:esterase/lipase